MARGQSRHGLGSRLVPLYERLRHSEAHLSGRYAARSNSVVHFSNAKYLLLESERADGTRVGTPMWFAVVEDTIFLRTEADAPKVRRISRRPIVNVAACTIDGIPLGDYIECMARIVPREREAHAEAALRRSYGLGRRLFNMVVHNDYVYLELTPHSQQTQVPEDQALALGVRAVPTRKDDGTPPEVT